MIPRHVIAYLLIHKIREGEQQNKNCYRKWIPYISHSHRNSVIVLANLQRISYLSHNDSCFQCNLAVTNFLVSNTYEIRFHDVTGQITEHMYSYTKVLKHG